MNIHWIEGVAILITVILIVAVKTFFDWSKEKQFQSLQSKFDSHQTLSLVRNGQIEQVPLDEIVVGDICLIFYGDSVPADGALIESHELLIDESSLTGETNLIKKNQNNFPLYAGNH